MVPVLSRTKTLLFAIVSKKEASLKSIPFFAAVPMPISVATGVARPKAQGQAITITDIETIKDLSKSKPLILHPKKVKIAIVSIVTEK